MMNKGGTVIPNRLIHEDSLYLLQHAYNPVNWYPWGTEAHLQAKKLDHPIFLSIGYAACHWCHVMEEECFKDQEVAELLNLNFIAIKVDREEHPEIDRIYMTVCQVMTGSGGWPLSIFLTPELKPFYAATFIPKRSRQNIPGMTDLIPHIIRIWNERREEVNEESTRIFEILSRRENLEGARESGATNSDDQIHSAYHKLLQTYDSEWGGFGRTPKFPSIPQIVFLFRFSAVYKNEEATRMAVTTLSSMAKGGIRDQIGYGFHRYAVDRAWRAPHFEKMLYDQAMNAIAYTIAWHITRDSLMHTAVDECLQYINKTLKCPDGVFASAEDADSPGGEGAFYLWKTDELREILAPEEYTLAERIWGIRDSGNLPPEAGADQGNNVISWIRTNRGKTGDQNSLNPEDARIISQIRTKLFDRRETRPRPRIDDKILTDWNGLTIGALAYSGRILNLDWMVQTAEDAASFLLTRMITGNGRLLHQWKAGKGTIEGTAQDYIFLASGLVSLFQTTGNPGYLKHAIQITQWATELFWDDRRGGFFATLDSDPLVPVRLRDDYDGPVPAVNGEAYQLLSELGVITGMKRYADQAAMLREGMSDSITQAPQGVLTLLGTICKEKYGVKAIITGEIDNPLRQKLWDVLHRKYIPGLVLIPVLPSNRSDLKALIPDIEGYHPDHGPEVWICANGACRPPVADPETLFSLLEQITHF